MLAVKDGVFIPEGDILKLCVLQHWCIKEDRPLEVVKNISTRYLL